MMKFFMASVTIVAFCSLGSAFAQSDGELDLELKCALRPDLCLSRSNLGPAPPGVGCNVRNSDGKESDCRSLSVVTKEARKTVAPSALRSAQIGAITPDEPQAAPSAPSAAPAPSEGASAMRETPEPESDGRTIDAVEFGEWDSKLQFKFGSAELSSASMRRLDALIRNLPELLEDGSYTVTVIGHASADGDPRANRTLSEQRAAVAAEYLKSALERSKLDLGIKFREEGRGADEPIPNVDARDPLQRRVIIGIVPAG